MHCIQHTVIHNTKMNLSTVKWAQWYKTHSRELLGPFICVCIALCTIVVHNIAHNRPYSFPSYPPDNHHSSDDVYLREGGFSARGRHQSNNILLTAEFTQLIIWYQAQQYSKPVHSLLTYGSCLTNSPLQWIYFSLVNVRKKKLDQFFAGQTSCP